GDDMAAPNRLLTPSLFLLAAATWLAAAVGTAAEPGGQSWRFDRDIRPLLAENCYACHGPGQQEAGLRLDSAEEATRELDSGARAIVAGDLATSEMVARIDATDPDTVMPPPHSKKTLTAEQKNLLKTWIAAGAPYERHWSHRPIERPAVPARGGADRGSPIDAFLAERLSAEGLPVNAEADRPTLIRRLSFALTGLPPTPEQVAAFVADGAADAYEKLVASMLASPRHGEEMARHWLDQARYADTHGLHLDNEREMWLYRDWVVKAFNDNLPFDQFTIQQIAGDLLPDATTDQKIATGFCRSNVTTSEGGSINEELLFRYAIDRTATMTNAWLGLTGQCAVCHSHKFDPLSQKEFYSLYAFFNSAADPGFDGNTRRTAPSLHMKTPSQEELLAAIDREMAPYEKALDEAMAAAGYVDPAEGVSPSGHRETMWLADGWPNTAVVRASPGGTLQWLDASADVAAQAGSRFLDIAATTPVQVVTTDGDQTFTIPEKGELAIHVWLDPADPPEAVMLQLRSRSWRHGVVWGDWSDVPFTDTRKTDHGLVHAGPLPKAGAWARLAIDPGRLQLTPGTRVKAVGIALARGHARLDSLGVSMPAPAATDPARSFTAWWKQKSAKQDSDLQDIPVALRSIVQQGPEKTTDQADVARLKRHWMTQVWASPPEPLVAAAADYDALAKIRDGIDDLIPRSLVFNDLPTMRDSFVMLRGAYDKPGEKVARGTPAFLPPLLVPEGQTPSRLDLARWLVSKEHPLTARVAANRLWQQFFGTGLVKTHEDFGLQGEPPSHPELLDWLAAEYRDAGWDTQRIVRLLVTSAAFKRSAQVQPQQLARDPENRLLARGPRIRLDAEQIRDQALFLSGLLVPTMGGRGVKPYQPDNIWEPVGFAGSNTRTYYRDAGASLYRRSLYTFLKRTAPPPFMSNFDAPSREAFCARRERSNTPLQALQLMNDVQHVEAARALAARALAASAADDAGRIDWLFRTVLARSPEPAEREVVAAALAANRDRYAADPAMAAKAIAHGDSPVPGHIPVVELAAWTLLSNTMLNLDEALTRN
ncbi:MAG: PSD1 and planctomycete cytochrome C domain-containing protein, partial [Planctomycetia bacterium]